MSERIEIPFQPETADKQVNGYQGNFSWIAVSSHANHIQTGLKIADDKATKNNTEYTLVISNI